MVTNVRGAFENVQGTLDFDPEDPRPSGFPAMIGPPQRDAICETLTSSTLRIIRVSPSGAIRWS